MSVRATGRLIADVVFVAGVLNSPRMIVKAVDEEAKTVTAIWFSDRRELQEAVFPAAALSRLEEEKAPVEADKPAGAKRGRKAKE
jgi:hypothetical protein